MQTLIVGRKINGDKFKPGNWVKRIASLGAEFGRDKRLKYHVYLQPVHLTTDTVLALAVDDRLKLINPSLYQFVIAFGIENDLEFKNEKEEVIQRTKSNVGEIKYSLPEAV